jgi:transcriptional regulator with XRE-family HTH domain
MALNDILKKLRNEKRWTLKEVAEKLGLVGHSTYSNWEYGRTEPDLEMLKKIASIYDVDVKYLLTGSNQEIDYESYNLNELLKDKTIKWDGVELTAEEKERALDILNILLKKQKDTK